ncbi:glutathione S-transferase D6 isoform X2 [Drosophila teissieri]|uniref:glutathione S-transferase D6 isoform X2 n=1 Tax=Drosophila teissieri TaxID=7243 RepID=UPI001CBA2986|nr:glutathione S-transferase D6 isoform X2 [Drosophila teissieri]
MDFYYSPRGSGCRTVIMVAKALGLELNKKLVNTLDGDQLKPEFVKLNPQHTIPTLVDNGFSIWESRAIAVYLIEQYAKDDSLFPKDPKKQALVNQRLNFDMGTLYESFAKYYFPIFRTGKPGTDEDFKKIEGSFEYLNIFLEGQDYVAGDHLTVADIAILSTVSTFVATLLMMDLYNMSGSPSTRAVMMTAKAVGVEFNSVQVNTFVGEQLKPWFVKINPQHTIPTLVDNGFVIWETRAIVVYLVEQYGKNDSLYPKDPQKQALINQRLYFDMGTLYDGIAKYFFPLLRTGKPGTQENLEKLNAAFDLLNTFLDGQDYVAGNELSVADIVILATVSTTEMVDFDFKKFPNVDRWYKNAQKVTPGWDENLERILSAKKFLAENLIEKL